jgi:cytochrome c oxidase subunit I
MNDPMFNQHLAWFLGRLIEEYLPPALLAIGIFGLTALMFSTLRAGQVTVPRHWQFGMLIMALSGGVTGWMLANAGVDRALHNTYYILAHFEYVAWLVACFGGFAAWYAWAPKLAGFQYDMRLAKLHFWLTAIGTAVLFFPQHFLGLVGMPRNYADYPDAFAKWNLVSTYGSYIVMAATLLFIGSTIHAFVNSRRRG